MHTLKNEVGLLELLTEREARITETVKRKELSLFLDKFELKSIKMERACALTKIAFYSGVPMNQVGDMVITKDGVFLKGGRNAGPVPINSRNDKSDSREQIRETGTGADSR